MALGVRIFGVLQDRGGVFHGVAAEPRFQRLIAGERARQVELNDRLIAEAPDLLEPPKILAAERRICSNRRGLQRLGTNHETSGDRSVPATDPHRRTDSLRKS